MHHTSPTADFELRAWYLKKQNKIMKYLLFNFLIKKHPTLESTHPIQYSLKTLKNLNKKKIK